MARSGASAFTPHRTSTAASTSAALSTAGPYAITYRFYRPIPGFIAGFSVTTAFRRTAI